MCFPPKIWSSSSLYLKFPQSKSGQPTMLLYAMKNTSEGNIGKHNKDSGSYKLNNSFSLVDLGLNISNFLASNLYE